jgi:hypothetical protein
VVGELTSLIALGIVLYQWMQYEEREAVRADRRADAVVAAGTTAPTSASPTHNGTSGASPDR